MSKQNLSLEERLAKHPKLKEHMLGLLAIAESDIELADEAEERTIEGVRGLGKQVLEEWAYHREESRSGEIALEDDTHRRGKKNSTG
jgi:hypothetical protein